MNLIIDLGNTQIKYFVFENDKVKVYSSVSIDTWKNTLTKIKNKYPLIKSCIISDVNGSITNDLKKVLAPLPIILCSSALKIPFSSIYKPISQLGSDRIALLTASAMEYPNQNILIIDLGSCITYDILDRGGLHHGGAISPGYHMRYKAMHSFSGRLPFLEPKDNTTSLGTNTHSAMHVGVSQGIKNEIMGSIAKYEEDFDFLTVILTGGDSERLPKPFKNGIFAHQNFLAKGLNFLLDSNID
jgi:type III pantothenate kinase